MTPNPLRELARLRKEATAGPWAVEEDEPEAIAIPSTAPAPARMRWDSRIYSDNDVADAAYIAAAGSISADQWEAIASVLEAAQAVVSSPLHTRELEPTVVFDAFREALAALDAATSQEIAGEAE